MTVAEEWYQAKFKIEMTEKKFDIITDMYYYIDFKSTEKPSVSVTANLIAEKTGFPENDIVSILDEFEKAEYVSCHEITSENPGTRKFYQITQKCIDDIHLGFPTRTRRDTTLARAAWIDTGIPTVQCIDGINVYDVDYSRPE